MATDDELPRAIIERVLSGPPEASIDVSIELLQILANALSNVIGEDGFESLLFRSARRAGNDYPWLQFDPRARPADPEFELLRHCFEGRNARDIQAASILLITTFIDILALLVGAHMTKLILESALGRARAAKLSKEQQHG
ncbi:MAG: hypothetical protein V4484_15480 [Pseudomonadota bacterium]